MTKIEILARLKEAGIEADPKLNKAALVALGAEKGLVLDAGGDDGDGGGGAALVPASGEIPEAEVIAKVQAG